MKAHEMSGFRYDLFNRNEMYVIRRTSKIFYSVWENYVILTMATRIAIVDMTVKWLHNP